MNYKRKLVERLLDVLKEFSLSDVLEFERTYDEQFHALSYLYARLPLESRFVELVVLNALVSYQLNCTGEKYWWEFARYFSLNRFANSEEGMKRYLQESKCNVRLRQQKLLRVEKAYRIVARLSSKIDLLAREQILLPRKLARELKTKLEAKTIAFSAKMLNYALRIIRRSDFPAPFEVPIPLDSRIQKISELMGARDPIRFWNDIAKKLGIPLLHIDSLLWVGYRLSKENLEFVEDRRVKRLAIAIRELFS